MSFCDAHARLRVCSYDYKFYMMIKVELFARAYDESLQNKTAFWFNIKCDCPYCHYVWVWFSLYGIQNGNQPGTGIDIRLAIEELYRYIICYTIKCNSRWRDILYARFGIHCYAMKCRHAICYTYTITATIDGYDNNLLLLLRNIISLN